MLKKRILATAAALCVAAGAIGITTTSAAAGHLKFFFGGPGPFVGPYFYQPPPPSCWRWSPFHGWLWACGFPHPRFEDDDFSHHHHPHHDRDYSAWSRMTRDDIARSLAELGPLDTAHVPGDLLGAYYSVKATSFLLDKRGRAAAERFGARHNCDFKFDPLEGVGIFTKRSAT